MPEALTPNRAEFKTLLRHVGNSYETRRNNHARLLSEVTPRLQAARRVERELDRHLSRRFNVFKYLRTDELGLSRVIADLLDPDAEHGQGTLFLREFLESIPESRDVSQSIRTDASNPIKVVTERLIPRGRRIDVSVEIPIEDGLYCLAIENKPYADDQDRQIADYLRFLNQRYGERFLLVYLPPHEREPSESSVTTDELEEWGERFQVMPYSGGDYSLADWVAACRKICEAEKLNWFLSQAEIFARQRFGESNMTSDAESREIRAYLLENPTQLQAALAIHDAWPAVRDEVCEGFFRHLRNYVEACFKEKLPDFARDLRIQDNFGGQKQYSNSIFIGLENRPWYRVGFQSHARQGPNSWLWGVKAPKIYRDMSASEKQLCDHVATSLKLGGLALANVKNPPYLWPQYEDVPRYRNWDSLAVDLHNETEARGGPITDYYVDGLLDIAQIAIPVIAELDKSDQSISNVKREG